MSDTVTPIVEKLHINAQTMKLRATMLLAGIAVEVTGQYNIDSNCYYPSRVLVFQARNFEGQTWELEEFCKLMEWDYQDTHDEIQKAVEERG